MEKHVQANVGIYNFDLINKNSSFKFESLIKRFCMIQSGTDKTYVFIPGGWQGAWAFDPITERLTKLNKKCFSLTLPGLELEHPEQNRIINLETHIQFVIDFILGENISNVILCGYSYSGMVITGCADRIPEKIIALIYIDAYVPKHGDSCWTLTNDIFRDIFAKGAGHDGITVAVPSGGDNRRRPHPLATFIQNVQLTGNYNKILNRAFIYHTGWANTPFTAQFEALKNSPGWQIETIDCGHNAMRESPDRLTQVLCDLEAKFKHEES